MADVPVNEELIECGYEATEHMPGCSHIFVHDALHIRLVQPSTARPRDTLLCLRRNSQHGYLPRTCRRHTRKGVQHQQMRHENDRLSTTVESIRSR